MLKNDYIPHWDTMRFTPADEISAILSNAAWADTNNVAFISRWKKKYKIDAGIKAEKFVVDWTKKLHLSNPSVYLGEMVSGSSEGGLVSLWHIREYQKDSGMKETTVLVSEHTHFSIIKACRILSMPYIIVKSKQDGTYNARALLSAMRKKILASPETGFIIVGTLGLPFTGKSDDLSILMRIKHIFSRRTCCNIHIDAAVGGLCSRFLNDSLPYFDQCDIDSFSIDYHKSGMCIYGTAVVVMKQNLYLSPSFSVPYHQSIEDVSLLGSKSSLHALCAEAVIKHVGTRWKTIFRNAMDLKKYFRHKIRSIKINVLSDPVDVPMLLLSFDKSALHVATTAVKVLDTDFFCMGNNKKCVRVFFNRQLSKHTIDDVIDKLNGVL